MVRNCKLVAAPRFCYTHPCWGLGEKASWGSVVYKEVYAKTTRSYADLVC
jgi:hypothetical protein